MGSSFLAIVGLFAASLAYAGGREVVVAVTPEERESGDASAETLMVIPLRSIEFVKVTGKNLMTEAAIVGMLVGGTVGGIYAPSKADYSSNGWMNMGDLNTALIFGSAVVGALTGIGVGAGIGSALSSEEMYLDPADPNFRETLQQAAAQQPSN